MKTNWTIIKNFNNEEGSNLPEAIRNLFDTNEEIRYKAYWQLDYHVVCQSDLYEGVYYVIEPIVQGLESNYTINRIDALTVLTEIALGGNGNEIIVLQDTGESMSVINACRKKLISLKARIAAIEVREQDEIEEKKVLLEEIERY